MWCFWFVAIYPLVIHKLHVYAINKTVDKALVPEAPSRVLRFTLISGALLLHQEYNMASELHRWWCSSFFFLHGSQYTYTAH